MEVNKIYNESCIDTLKRMPDNFLDCVITSPPYWQLRKYAIEFDAIWDGDENCEHEWFEYKQGAKGGVSKIDNMPKVGNNAKEQTLDISIRFGYESNFCSKCGAWKGQLGLEPTFELYLKHLWQIMDLIYLKLKPTGTVWINLGDTYSTQGGKNTGGEQKQYDSTYLQNKNTPDGKDNAKLIKDKSLPNKCLLLIPHRFAIGCIDPDWELRNDLTDEELLFVIKELKKYGL